MLISIVLPFFNESNGLSLFWDELKKHLEKLNYEFELIWVDDGSTDDSAQIFLNKIFNNAEKNKNYRHIFIQFSRNFGHDAAMMAGIENSTGDGIICMDTDLQHPPQLIERILENFKQGYQIIMMKRQENLGQSKLKNFLSASFYKFMNFLADDVKFIPGASDYFFISRTVANILTTRFNHSILFLRGTIQNLGFKIKTIEFIAPPRQYGESKYNFKKLMSLAMKAVFNFSFKPLHISRLLAVLYAIFSLGLGIYTIYQYLFGQKPPSGYTTIVLFMSLSFAFLFILMSIISYYFENLIKEVRRKPSYIIARILKQN
jgi:dolichol-phosphate mannosyltransferase